MLKTIEAQFHCDICGAAFVVDLDPAEHCVSNWTLYEHAEDAIRGGQYYRGPGETYGAWIADDGRHLCGACQDQEAAQADER